jgi:DNA-binding NtrC family response regulator
MSISADQSGTWKDQPNTADGPQVLLRPHLVLAFECDRPLAGGARSDLSEVDEVVVGRGPERTVERRTVAGTRQLLVRAPDPWLSALHARLRRGPEGWLLEDAGSTNGSSVEGHRVARCWLRDGDLVELGHCFFLLRQALPTSPDTPADVDLSDDCDHPAFATVIPGLREDYLLLERVARSMVGVVLVGETGTGKELLAQAIHAASKRPGPFVALNCGAIPMGLVEAHLAGHVKGAFTGAIRDEPGIVRAAHGGTLLFDEVAELDRPAQVALLRIIQERSVQPVGASTPVPVDVRFLAATHEPLQCACDRGSFRSDLLARLEGFEYRLRPLRERIEDLGVCIAAILRKMGSVAPLRYEPYAARLLLKHMWPGNIRELEQCLLRSSALAEKGLVRAHCLPPAIRDGTSCEGTPGVGEGSPQSPPRGMRSRLSEADSKTRARILTLLERHEGNITAVSNAMGKARPQVQRWLRRFGIDAAKFRRGGGGG